MDLGTDDSILRGFLVGPPSTDLLLPHARRGVLALRSPLPPTHRPPRNIWPQAPIQAQPPAPILPPRKPAQQSINLTMPPKQRVPASTGAPSTPSAPARSSRPSTSNADAQDILQGVWNKYTQKTPQRTKLLDTFMAFLVAVGALQFLYVVVVGNFVRTTP